MEYHVFMTTEDGLVAITALFIAGMTWLRTRLQYRKRQGESLHLLPAGQLYFAALVATLALGWFAAPALGQLLWPAALATTTLMRVLWFMSSYFIFIMAHRALAARGQPLFIAR